MDWDKELKHWVRRKPRDMAQMRVDIKVLVEDQKFWHPNKGLANYLIGDDCKPCAGLALLNKLNMAQGALIPTSQSIVAANIKILHILGAVMLEIWAEKEGNVKFTRQFCYICKEVTGFYLSLSACEDLDGVLPWNKGCSPTGVNEIRHVEEDKDDEEGQDKVVKYDTKSVEEFCGTKLAKCGCPVRSKSPPLPEKMPFEEREVDKL